MIRREIIEKVEVTCDFCGKEFEPSSYYPKNKYGELAKFNLSLTFGFTDEISGNVSIYGEDSPMMGYCTGHICQECLKAITERIKHFKASTEDKGKKEK